MSKKIVIVGGGIIGVSSAWYLAKAGHEVTVVDRGTIGGACSAGNCGLVCPSHVLPLTEPGAFKEAAKSFLNPKSAFRVKPRLDPALWSWMWNFAKRCNKSSMVQAAHAIQALLTSAMQEYLDWVGREEIECEWQARGLLFAYRDRKSLDAYDETNELLSTHFNEPAIKLLGDEAVELEPALRSQIAGAWYYERDAHLRPDILMSAIRERLEKSGVAFIENCEFKSFCANPSDVGENSNATSIETTKGAFSADTFLFASGSWTPLLKEHLGCEVPIQPGKGYSITMPRPQVCPRIPLIFPEEHVAVTPMESGYRLGSIMEFCGYDETINPARLQMLREGAKPFLREPYCEPVVSTWYGWRPMTYDSIPVMDRSPRWNNVWISAGHNMLGLSMAPASGKLVSELINGQDPHLDPSPYRLSRFGI